MRQQLVLVGVACLLPLSLLVSSCATKAPGIPVACQEQATLTPACFDALYARYRPFLEASTQIAVGLYLSQHAERAAPMYHVMEQVQARLSQEQLTTLAALEAVIRQHVTWEELPPGVRAGIDVMMRAVRVALEGFLEDAGVEEPQQVRLVLRDVVDWVTVAALVSCDGCTAQVSREVRQ